MGLTMSRQLLLYMSCCNDVYRKPEYVEGELFDAMQTW